MDRDRPSPERIDNPFAARRASVGKATARAEPVEVRPAALELRAMTGFEEEAVERLVDEPNTARLCNEIVARCLVPPGADHQAALARVRGLTIPERDAALVRVRRLSLGDRVEAEISCPQCGTKNEIDFSMADLPLEPEPPPSSVLDVVLPDGTAARVRLPTAGDQEALLDEAPSTAAERRTWLIAHVLLGLGEHEGPFDDGFARALPTATRRALEAALDEALPTADLSMRVRCVSCRAEVVEPFDVTGFFLPS